MLLIPDRSHVTDPGQEVLPTGRVSRDYIMVVWIWTICTVEVAFIFTVNSSFGVKCVHVCAMRFTEKKIGKYIHYHC